MVFLLAGVMYFMLYCTSKYYGMMGIKNRPYQVAARV